MNIGRNSPIETAILLYQNKAQSPATQALQILEKNRPFFESLSLDKMSSFRRELLSLRGHVVTAQYEKTAGKADQELIEKIDGIRALLKEREILLTMIETLKLPAQAIEKTNLGYKIVLKNEFTSSFPKIHFSKEFECWFLKEELRFRLENGPYKVDQKVPIYGIKKDKGKLLYLVQEPQDVSKMKEAPRGHLTKIFKQFSRWTRFLRNKKRE